MTEIDQLERTGQLTYLTRSGIVQTIPVNWPFPIVQRVSYVSESDDDN